ncbi:pyridoxamine kinase [Parablautia intestinalis]|uniref:pyridoxamine kinase n=1 Tax=Parablautia intestinalis TaxID=2320100 RepID=UPI00256F0786|nr:pyridoxamine kinase [Parablautia intestinalis]
MVQGSQKKIAAINDLTGYGRCALTVSMPVISHMKIQCCPVPTSILSNHTGYEEYFFDDYTGRLPAYLRMWKKLGLEFDGIMSGFLGSKEQIGIVEEFIRQFRKKNTIVVVDPVMGDHGKIAGTYTEEMCHEMRKLVSYADIITPNLTEACKLTDTPYRESGWKMAELFELTGKLRAMGPEKVVITGIPQGKFIANYMNQENEEPMLLRTFREGTERCGTGDLFASIIAADAVNGVSFVSSVRKASLFVKKCMIKSMEMGIDRKNGVCFEEILHLLKV